MKKNVLAGIGLIALGGANMAFCIINAVETARADKRLIKMRKEKEELIKCVNETREDLEKVMSYSQHNNKDLADLQLCGVRCDLALLQWKVEGL